MALVLPCLQGELHIDSLTISLIFIFYDGTFMWYGDINPEVWKIFWTCSLQFTHIEQKVESGVGVNCKLIDKTLSIIISDDPIFICNTTVFSVFTAQFNVLNFINNRNTSSFQTVKIEIFVQDNIYIPVHKKSEFKPRFYFSLTANLWSSRLIWNIWQNFVLFPF